MKPVSPASDDDDLRTAEASDEASKLTHPTADSAELAALETIQRRYVSQLNEDIKRLEADKAQLQTDVATLQANYARLQADIQATKAGPRLPGEPAPSWTAATADIYGRSVELPFTPATSQPGGLVTREAIAKEKAALRKGLILSAIATLLMAWHYGLIGALAQGGSWLGLTVGQIGLGFVPAVALLWLRMLVMVPALLLLATQIHRRTWEDLQSWIYTRDQLMTVLIGSGIALFFSQVLLYQSIAQAGPVLGATLLFLYPLIAVPLGLLTRRSWTMSPLGLVALAAIAMGGFLTIRPAIRPVIGMAPPAAIWLGLLASAAFALYIVLTSVSYSQQCHPIPVGVVQFSTVAVLSSIVLIVKPLELTNISWLSFALWGIALGVVMLLVYLFNYSSLRMIGTSTATFAAATPLATSAIAWSFALPNSLEIIQWTGILMLSIGGVALSQERLSKT